MAVTTLPRLEISEADVREFLQRIGEDPKRAGITETPARILRALPEIFFGYFAPEDFLEKQYAKSFESTADNMVIQTGIPVYSFCEHHMLPFFGSVAIGYLPQGRVIGASKLTRIVDYFARRLQIQENLTEQIGHSLVDNLNCAGVMVVMRCTHLCMVYRGIKEKNITLTTSTALGMFRESDAARNEFMRLAESNTGPF